MAGRPPARRSDRGSWDGDYRDAGYRDGDYRAGDHWAGDDTAGGDWDGADWDRDYRDGGYRGGGSGEGGFPGGEYRNREDGRYQDRGSRYQDREGRGYRGDSGYAERRAGGGHASRHGGGGHVAPRGGAGRQSLDRDHRAWGGEDTGGWAGQDQRTWGERDRWAGPHGGVRGGTRGSRVDEDRHGWADDARTGWAGESQAGWADETRAGWADESRAWRAGRDRRGWDDDGWAGEGEDSAEYREAGDDSTGGAEGNERLTALTGSLLLVLFAAEGVTILSVHRLLTLHFFLGMLLIGPVALKACAVLYRFVRYYTGATEYQRKGPPAPLLRLLGPVVMITSLSVLGTGVMLAIVGPSGAGTWLFLHRASFILWFGAMTVHVLAYVWRLPRLISGDMATRAGYRAHEILAGRGARWLLLAASVLTGLLLAVLTVHRTGIWFGIAH